MSRAMCPRLSCAWTDALLYTPLWLLEFFYQIRMFWSSYTTPDHCWIEIAQCFPTYFRYSQ